MSRAGSELLPRMVPAVTLSALLSICETCEPRHATKPDDVCWKFLKNSVVVRSEADLLNEAVVVMQCAPRLVTDRDLKSAVGSACYAEVILTAPPALGARTPSVGAPLPVTVLSDLSKEGWALGFPEWRLLRQFCPTRFLWYFYPDGSPVQPDVLTGRLKSV